MEDAREKDIGEYIRVRQDFTQKKSLYHFLQAQSNCALLVGAICYNKYDVRERGSHNMMATLLILLPRNTYRDCLGYYFLIWIETNLLRKETFVKVTKI